MPIFGPIATWDNGPEVPDACILSGVLCVCQFTMNEIVQFFVYCRMYIYQ